MNQDREHLRLLSVFHYVLAGITALGSMIPLFHLIFGLAIALGHLDGADEFPPIFGWLFVALAGAFILAGLSLAVCLALAGRKLAKREGYTFCLVVAAFSCILMPFGTVLGIFTLIVLMRDSVRELFGRTAPEGLST